jgi:hypothetical protein
MSRDEIIGNILDPMSLNRYAYVKGNPVVGIDPRGYDPDFDLNDLSDFYGPIEQRKKEAAIDAEIKAMADKFDTTYGVSSAYTSESSNTCASRSSNNGNSVIGLSGLRAPDYASFNVGGGWPQYGGSLSLIEDRYGNFYFSYGRSWGQKGFSASGASGYIVGGYPSEEECKSFLTGPSILENATYIVGVETSTSISNGQTGVAGAIGLPSATVTMSNSNYIFNIRKAVGNLWKSIAG